VLEDLYIGSLTQMMQASTFKKVQKACQPADVAATINDTYVVTSPVPRGLTDVGVMTGVPEVSRSAVFTKSDLVSFVINTTFSAR
jgi:hypothetical protein